MANYKSFIYIFQIVFWWTEPVISGSRTFWYPISGCCQPEAGWVCSRNERIWFPAGSSEGNHLSSCGAHWFPRQKAFRKRPWRWSSQFLNVWMDIQQACRDYDGPCSQVPLDYICASIVELSVLRNCFAGAGNSQICAQLRGSVLNWCIIMGFFLT